MWGDTDGVLALGRVRRLGTHLPPAGRSPAEARAFVQSALRSWGVPVASAEDIVLAASELVTNAYEHGRGWIAVRLCCAGYRVTLEVRDTSDEDPVLRQPAPTSPRGRGLTLIDAVSTAWGHHRAGDGKWVWAEFALA